MSDEKSPTQSFFFNRRSGKERRDGVDPRENPRLDLPHRRRRTRLERRAKDSLKDDFLSIIDFNEEDFQFLRDKH